MSTHDDFDWSAPPLSSEDQRLIDAYVRAGRFLDDLPYTAEFDKLVLGLGEPDNQESRHFIFRRLLNLRKMGRLPRLSMVAP